MPPLRSKVHASRRPQVFNDTDSPGDHVAQAETMDLDACKRVRGDLQRTESHGWITRPPNAVGSTCFTLWTFKT